MSDTTGSGPSGYRLNASPDSEAASFDPRLRALRNHWHAERTDGDPPDRAAFSPDTLKPWLGHISIYELTADGADFFIRLEGTKVVDATGEDWTGQRLSAVDRRFGTNLRDQVLATIDAREPRFLRARIFQREYRMSECVLLPVRGASGEIDQDFLCLYVV